MLWKEGEAVLPVQLLANCKDIPSVGTRRSGRVQLTKSPLIALHAPQRPVSLRCLAETRFFCWQCVQVRMTGIASLNPRT